MLWQPLAGEIVEVDSGRVWAGARLEAEARRRSALLSAAGVKAGARVLIAHAGTASFFADLFACWSLGACAACANPTLTASELAKIARLIAPSAVLVDRDYRQEPDIDAPLLCAADESAGRAADEAATSLDDPALILFTSGTTGTPKGVVHSFRSLLARASLNRAHLGDDALERTLCTLPTHFGHGLIGNCLTPLLAGARLLLATGGGVRRAADLGALIDEHRVTFISSVPSTWKLALRLSEAPSGRSLRQVSVGSAPLSADLWGQIICWSGTDNVVNMYGITETANWIAGASAASREPEDGLIGRPWGGALAVLTAAGEIARSGEGELLVRTPSLMSGYFGDAALTERSLICDWFRTGDLGRIDGEGGARLTGRLKDEINRAGIKISPEEIDLLLERHPAVAEACAFGVADEVAGEIVGAAVRLVEGASLSAGDLRGWCQERIRAEAMPQRLFFVDEIPKTDRGKIQRRRVRSAVLER